MSDDNRKFTDNSRDETITQGLYAGASEAAKRANASLASFGEMGVGNVKTALRLHSEMFDVLHDISRDWFARATSDAELAFQLPNRLTAAQTMPDALTAYNEWLNEWMNRCNEDSRRFVADSQRIVDKGVSCFAATSPGSAT